MYAQVKQSCQLRKLINYEKLKCTSNLDFTVRVKYIVSIISTCFIFVNMFT